VHQQQPGETDHFYCLSSGYSFARVRLYSFDSW